MCVGTTLITKDFEILKKKRGNGQPDREREGSGFSDSESVRKKCRNFSVNFLKPSLSIYSIPLGLGLNYLALK